jgi:hypothetical protein
MSKEIWFVKFDKEIRSAFSTEDKAYEEACDEILVWLMLAEDYTSPFLELYDKKEFKLAFENALEHEMSLESDRIEVTTEGELVVLDKSNFLHDEE